MWLLAEAGGVHGSCEGTERLKFPAETSVWGTHGALRRQT